MRENGRRRLDVELCAPPVAAFCVVLEYAYSNLESHVQIHKVQGTHLNFSIRLQTEPLGNGSITQIVNKSSQAEILGCVFTGSGEMPWRECALFGRTFGKANKRKHVLYQFHRSIVQDEQHTIVLAFGVVWHVGGKGEKNKVRG